jgi:hypothetical protein
MRCSVVLYIGITILEELFVSLRVEVLTQRWKQQVALKHQFPFATVCAIYILEIYTLCKVCYKLDTTSTEVTAVIFGSFHIQILSRIATA